MSGCFKALKFSYLLLVHPVRIGHIERGSMELSITHELAYEYNSDSFYVPEVYIETHHVFPMNIY